MKGDINCYAGDRGFIQPCCNLTVALDNFLPLPESPHLSMKELVAVAATALLQSLELLKGAYVRARFTLAFPDVLIQNFPCGNQTHHVISCLHF